MYFQNSDFSLHLKHDSGLCSYCRYSTQRPVYLEKYGYSGLGFEGLFEYGMLCGCHSDYDTKEQERRPIIDSERARNVVIAGSVFVFIAIVTAVGFAF